MHTVRIADHRWYFHSNTGKNTGSLHDIMGTGSHIEVAMIKNGGPINTGTTIVAPANMATGMANGIGNTGIPLIEDNTVTKGSITTVTPKEDFKGINTQGAVVKLAAYSWQMSSRIVDHAWRWLTPKIR